ncbi:LexA family protein [Clostridium oryzae]|uniref:LexA repressor n=1 Tax=Clostridium oryzae TaxID=1450648 RepID=A0A1V4IY72_9CLOT|nr:LexA family transcriptional regulator [Clostridium oryzae]OPJ65018.1 LexA repressor [Clostridium oryzae]
MELDKLQKRVVMGKPFGCSVIKGSEKTGKTTIAAHRALYLQSSYCLYEHEKVIVVSKNTESKETIKNIYYTEKAKGLYEYITLFSISNSYAPDFVTVDEITEKLYRKNTYDYIEASERQRLEIIKECINELDAAYSKLKFVRNGDVDFIKDEIDWMKACNINDTETYQNVKRIGRKTNRNMICRKRLNRNSAGREAMFQIFTAYNQKMRQAGLIDREDKEDLALESLKMLDLDRYTHIIVDDAQVLSKKELDMIVALGSERTYSSIMLLINNNIKCCVNGSWLVKTRKQREISLKFDFKNSYLKKSYKEINKIKYNINQKKSDRYIEKYAYYDLNKKIKFDFEIDASNRKEFILKQDDQDMICQEEELRNLPVYSYIAAGNPIMMNDELQGTFRMPNIWLKGKRDCFILKVRGDSMMGADIEDGDSVVIKQQNTAVSGDIVAVDISGSTTLKRLYIGKKGVFLMPENEKYSPIPVKDDNTRILGVVAGILKSVN